jgi:hypothetical protein
MQLQVEVFLSKRVTNPAGRAMLGELQILIESLHVVLSLPEICKEPGD